VERQRLLVELGALNRAGRALEAQADELRRGDRPGADRAWRPVDIAAVVGQRPLARPVPVEILPGTGRWQPAGLTEGILVQAPCVRRVPTTILRMVPLPVPGR
jgi:hypothetical protein